MDRWVDQYTAGKQEHVSRLLFDADISGRNFPRETRPDDLLDSCRGTQTFSRVVFRHRGCDERGAGGQAGGMAAIGVARLGDQQQLVDAGAALVVTNLEDDMQQPGLEDHRLEYGAAEIPILELLCHRTSISVGPPSSFAATEEIRRSLQSDVVNMHRLLKQGVNPWAP
jgi:hypothetical protein